MNQSVLKAHFAILLLMSACVLTGCGGTKVLKKSQPIQASQPLAVASDEQARVTLDWVVVRDGPGTWAKNADWDEYLLRVGNSSDQPIQVTGLVVIDSLGMRAESQSRRKDLVKASKRAARRYKESGIKVKAGAGAGTMLVTGAAVTVVGVGAAQAVAYGSFMAGGTSAGTAGAAAGGLLLLGPVVAVGGIMRGLNNSAVNKQIQQRQTAFPLDISTGEEAALDIFFPLVPSPQTVELSYTDTTGEHTLVIETGTALSGLHLVERDE